MRQALLAAVTLLFTCSLIAEPALNLIYFMPSDVEAVPGYEERLDKIMRYIQDFYNQEMTRHGYPDKQMKLPETADKRVKFTALKVEKDRSHFGYSGGGGPAIQEIEAFFRANPNERHSQHTLVIMPSFNDDPYNPGGVPFYGMGRYCFALDYPLYDLKYLGKPNREGQLLTKWLGGMAHELGHGLNLPHNLETKTERLKRGTALMGAGNYTLGQRPTFLTAPSAAILNNNEIFNPPGETYYRGNPQLNVKSIAVKRENNTFIITGQATAKTPINAVNLYIDGAPYGHVNNNYDATAFTVKPDADGNFSFQLAMDEIERFVPEDYQVRVDFLHINGLSSRWTKEYIKQ